MSMPLMALAQYKQHNTQKALDAASKAYQLDPNELDTFIYSNIQYNKPVIITLDGRTFIFSPE